MKREGGREEGEESRIGRKMVVYVCECVCVCLGLRACARAFVCMLCGSWSCSRREGRGDGDDGRKKGREESKKKQKLDNILINN